MRKNVLFPSVVVGTAALSLAVTAIVSRPKALAQTGSGSWVAYQIAYKIYASKPGAPPILVADEVRAVRSDGATAESSTFYHMDGAKDRLQRILTLPGGIRIKTDDALGIMSATKNPSEDMALSPSHQRDPSQSCMGSPGGRKQPAAYVASAGDTFLGYATYKITGDLGRYKDTIWRAPAVGCAEVHSEGQKIDTTSGQLISTSETVAVSIRLGEPDPKLFELPAGLRNMSPAEMVSLQASICCNKQLSATELAPMQQAEDHFRRYRFDF